MKALPDAGPERTRALILLAVLAAVVAWVWWPGPEPAVVTAAGPPAQTPARAPAQAAGSPLGTLELPQQVNLAVLERGSAAGAVGRNLFRFGARPLPPPPPLPPMPAGPTTSVPPPVPAGPPPVPLRLTGRFDAPDGRIVVTLKQTETGALFHATEGDVVDGRFRVVKVGATSAVVAYLDGSGQRTLMLGGG